MTKTVTNVKNRNDNMRRLQPKISCDLYQLQNPTAKQKSMTISEPSIGGIKQQLERSYLRNRGIQWDKCPENETLNQTWSSKLYNSLQCDICHTVFVSQYSLNQHMLTCHKDEGLHKCHVCPRSFLQASKLDTHIQLFHTQDNSRMFRCKLCDLTFKTDVARRSHVLLHVGEKPNDTARQMALNPCPFCTKTFSQKNNLDHHMAIHHGNGKKQFHCKKCNKSFLLKAYYAKHMKNSLAHSDSGTGSKVCKVCGKTFTEQGTLTKHMRIHTGEKPFICRQCGKMFNWKESLERHKTIHNTDIVNKFACKICGKTFRLKCYHDSHVKQKHKKLGITRCSVCLKEFATKHYCKIHFFKKHGKIPKQEYKFNGLNTKKEINNDSYNVLGQHKNEDFDGKDLNEMETFNLHTSKNNLPGFDCFIKKRVNKPTFSTPNTLPEGSGFNTHTVAKEDLNLQSQNVNFTVKKHLPEKKISNKRRMHEEKSLGLKGPSENTKFTINSLFENDKTSFSTNCVYDTDVVAQSYMLPNLDLIVSSWDQNAHNSKIGVSMKDCLTGKDLQKAYPCTEKVVLEKENPPQADTSSFHTLTQKKNGNERINLTTESAHCSQINEKVNDKDDRLADQRLSEFNRTYNTQNSIPKTELTDSGTQTDPVEIQTVCNTKVGVSTDQLFDDKAKGQVQHNGEIQQRMLSSNLPQFSCLVCKARFLCSGTLTHHSKVTLQRLIIDVNEKFECGKCPETFCTIKAVKNHVYNNHCSENEVM